MLHKIGNSIELVLLPNYDNFCTNRVQTDCCCCYLYLKSGIEKEIKKNNSKIFIYFQCVENYWVVLLWLLEFNLEDCQWDCWMGNGWQPQKETLQSYIIRLRLLVCLFFFSLPSSVVVISIYIFFIYFSDQEFTMKISRNQLKSTEKFHSSSNMKGKNKNFKKTFCGNYI